MLCTKQLNTISYIKKNHMQAHDLVCKKELNDFKEAESYQKTVTPH